MYCKEPSSTIIFAPPSKEITTQSITSNKDAMKPKVRITLSIFTFVAMVLTGMAAAEQLPTHQPTGSETLIGPSIITLSPKLIHKKSAVQTVNSVTDTLPAK